MPILSVILAAAPTLIKLAEGLFSGSPDKPKAEGSVKKAFVMKAFELIYDAGIGKIVHDFPGVDERKFFLELASVCIDNLVPSLTK